MRGAGMVRSRDAAAEVSGCSCRAGCSQSRALKLQRQKTMNETSSTSLYGASPVTQRELHHAVHTVAGLSWRLLTNVWAKPGKQQKQDQSLHKSFSQEDHMHLCFPYPSLLTMQWIQLNFFKIQSDLVWKSDSIAVKTPCVFFLCLQLRPLMIQRQVARICGLLSASVCKALNWSSFHLLK